MNKQIIFTGRKILDLKKSIIFNRAGWLVFKFLAISYVTAGLKVFSCLWEHLCYQVSIFSPTPVILGAQLKIFGAHLDILRVPEEL